MLLKYEDGKWIPVFDINHPSMVGVKTFDVLSYNGLRMMFSGGRESEDKVENWLFREGGLLTPPDWQIVINDLAPSNSYFFKRYKLPVSLKRKWKLMGPFDVMGDRTLQYWMYR